MRALSLAWEFSLFLKLSLRRFLGCDWTEATPDPSSLSRIRQRLPQEIYQEVFHRRTPLRGRANISKRVCLHGSAFNLGLAMRKLIGCGTPRGLRALRPGLRAWAVLGRWRRAADGLRAWVGNRSVLIQRRRLRADRLGRV